MTRDGIGFEIAPCALGWLLVAGSRRGVCHVRFGDDPAALEAALRETFPFAALRRGEGAVADWAATLVRAVEGETPAAPVPLDVRGSQFQRRVWDALRAIPRGDTRT